MRVAKCNICNGPSEHGVSVRAQGVPAGSVGRLADLCNACHAKPNHMAILQDKFFPNEAEREAAKQEAERIRLYNESKVEYYRKHPEEAWACD